MNELNCPNCGTTYQSTKSGYCDCCGYEFTDTYISQFIAAEKEKEKELQQELAEENRRKQILIEKQEREKREKLIAEKKARKEADKAYIKERKDRERIKYLIENNNKRYEKELKFSLLFKKFRKVTTTIGIILVIASFISSIAFSDKLGVNFIAPQNVISCKLETIINEHIILVKYDGEQNIFKITNDAENDLRLPKGFVKLFNSISSSFNNQSTVEEKLSYMFPKSKAFIIKFIESS